MDSLHDINNNGSTRNLINDENEEKKETQYGLWSIFKEAVFNSNKELESKQAQTVLFISFKIPNLRYILYFILKNLEIYPDNKDENKAKFVNKRAENAILKIIEETRRKDFIEYDKKTLLENVKNEIRYLLNRGVDINFEDQFKDTPLLEVSRKYKKVFKK